MCEAFDQAEERGEKRGEQRGILLGEQKTLYRLVKKGLLTLTQASEQSEMDREQFLEGYEEFQKEQG